MADERVPIPEAKPVNLEDYHFFVGLDFKIPTQGEYYPMVGLYNGRAQLRKGDELVLRSVPGLKSVEVEKSTKISPHFAFVSDFTYETAYSMARDPHTQATVSQMQMSNLAMDAQNQAELNLRELGDIQASVDEAAVLGADTSALTDQASQVGTDFANLLSQADSFANLSTDMANREVLHDMLHIDLTISSPERVERPYLIFVCHLKDAPRADVDMTWFAFHELQELTPEPQEVTLRLHAFPDGKLVDQIEVYCYSRGNEIPTNLSPKRVDLSKEDAKNYLNKLYLTRNRDKSAPARTIWNEDLGSLMTAYQRVTLQRESVEVDVDAEGNVTAVRADKSLAEHFTPRIEDAIRSMFFYPALEEGKAVPSTVQVRFKDFIY